MINWNLPVETMDEPPRPVRVLCTDGPKLETPVVALVDYDVMLFSEDGVSRGDLPMGKKCVSLRNVTPKPRIVMEKRWVNVYPGGSALGSGAWSYEEDANKKASHSRIACIEIDYPVAVYDEPKRMVKQTRYVNVRRRGQSASDVGIFFLNKDEVPLDNGSYVATVTWEEPSHE